jgi:hypothetical protein
MQKKAGETRPFLLQTDRLLPDFCVDLTSVTGQEGPVWYISEKVRLSAVNRHSTFGMTGASGFIAQRPYMMR